MERESAFLRGFEKKGGIRNWIVNKAYGSGPKLKRKVGLGLAGLGVAGYGINKGLKKVLGDRVPERDW